MANRSISAASKAEKTGRKSAALTNLSLRPRPRRGTGTAKAVPPSPEDRRQLIAQAAYFIAERRGFASGSELDDWLQAEAEIDGRLARSRANDPNAN